MRLLIVLMVAIGVARPALAETFRIGAPLCYAVGQLSAPDRTSGHDYSCDGTPHGYDQASLWLHADLRRLAVDRNDLVLMVHHSRYDRLAVAFSYADGAIEWQRIATGNFGDRWRIGGQAAFEAPVRDAPLVALTMRFDRPASHELLRMRLVTRAEAGAQTATLAALIGAALTLLLVGAVYNASLALAVRRQYLFWHAAWAILVLAWGVIWSQIDLLVAPEVAGSIGAQICTFLACLAITAATLSAATSVDTEVLPRWAPRVVIALGVAVGLFGIPTAIVRTAAITAMGEALAILVLADLAAVAVLLGWAWRRGSGEARDLAAAWSVPMAALALTQLIDVGTLLWGGGAQVLVLFAAAWQTIWLSVAATRRLAILRVERDAARAAEARASELAGRDPLTGLHNRRGFVHRVALLLGDARPADVPAALLLIDIDRFKSINDAFGHEAGDLVLCAIAARLRRWESDSCAVARLGGEEFALAIIGIDGFALVRFADGVRQELAALNHGSMIGDRVVTVSIGVVQTRGLCDFQHLYRRADAALYLAKQGGRDRVMVHDIDGDAPAPSIFSTGRVVARIRG